MTLTRTVNGGSMLSSSRAKIHEPLVTGVSHAPRTSAAPGKLPNTRALLIVDCEIA